MCDNARLGEIFKNHSRAKVIGVGIVFGIFLKILRNQSWIVVMGGIGKKKVVCDDLRIHFIHHSHVFGHVLDVFVRNRICGVYVKDIATVVKRIDDIRIGKYLAETGVIAVQTILESVKHAIFVFKRGGINE